MGMRDGYQQTDAGLIPADWSALRLSDIGEALIGLTYSPSDVATDGVLVLRSSNVQNGALCFEDNVYVKANIPERIMVRQGDILICVRNGSRDLIGKCALIDGRAKGMTFGAFMAVFRTHDSGFIHQQFKSSLIQRQVREHLGATINQITNKSLNSFVAAFPDSKVEREAVAEVLSDADALVESLEQLLAKKRKIKQGAMQEMLTGKRRLSGFGGQWKETTFSTVVQHHSGNSTLIKGRLATRESGGMYPGFSASGQDVWCDHYENEGDAIVVSAVGSRCGKAFLATGKWCAIANTHVVWPIHSKVDLRFLQLFINDEKFWLKSGSGQPFVLFKPSFAQSLLLPSLPEQKAIADVLFDMDAEIAALHIKLTKTRQLKQGMMQELLTGRIRLV